MITKVAILIDGGFFSQCFKAKTNKYAKKKDVLNEVDNTMAFIKSKTNGETTDVLLRVFYYDSMPFDGKIKQPDGEVKDYSLSPMYINKESFLNDLGRSERFALRLGELSFGGWKQDPKDSSKVIPDFKQKGVDMRIGLDIAWISTKHIVDKIAIIGGDSDFIAPIKFARKEGLQIYLNKMGNNIKDDLYKHCDFVL